MVTRNPFRLIKVQMASILESIKDFRDQKKQFLHQGKIPAIHEIDFPTPSHAHRAKQFMASLGHIASPTENSTRIFHPSFYGIGHYTELILYSLAEKYGYLNKAMRYCVLASPYSTIPWSLYELVRRGISQELYLEWDHEISSRPLSCEEFLRLTNREHLSDDYQKKSAIKIYPPMHYLVLKTLSNASHHDFSQINKTAHDLDVSSEFSQQSCVLSLRRNPNFVRHSLPAKYILLHLRTPRHYQCFRDPKHDEYNLLVNRMIEVTNLPVVRLGYGPALIPRDGLIDLCANFYQDDIVQILLGSSLYIGNPSGPLLLAGILRCPLLVIDCPTPFASASLVGMLPNTYIHARENPEHCSLSEELVSAFDIFFESLNSCKDGFTLNGKKSDIIKAAASFLSEMYSCAISRCQLICTQKRADSIRKTLAQGEFIFY